MSDQHRYLARRNLFADIMQDWNYQRSKILTAIRCVPALILCLLTASWLVGIVLPHGVSFYWQKSDGAYWGLAVLSGHGAIGMNSQTLREAPPLFLWPKRTLRLEVRTIMGGLPSYRRGQFQGVDFRRIAIPIPWVITALLPVAIGTLRNFKFSLWMYFVWIFLFSVNLAVFTYLVSIFK